MEKPLEYPKDKHQGQSESHTNVRVDAEIGGKNRFRKKITWEKFSPNSSSIYSQILENLASNSQFFVSARQVRPAPRINDHVLINQPLLVKHYQPFKAI